jgi:DNA-binding MarR family transcriptional regulator
LENRTEKAVAQYLATVGITRLAEWDVLQFVYRHGTSLASAERIASQVGYSKAVVGAALEALTSAGFIRRSRNSRGVRLYQLIVGTSGDPQQSSLEELIKLADGREGRLLMIRSLAETSPRKNLRAGSGLA